MSDDVWKARAAAFLRVFLPIRDRVACHGAAVLPESVTAEEYGLVNLHAVVTEQRYVGTPIPALPGELVQPLAFYLNDLLFYAPDLRPGDEEFGKAAEQHALVTDELPRPLAVAAS